MKDKEVQNEKKMRMMCQVRLRKRIEGKVDNHQHIL